VINAYKKVFLVQIPTMNKLSLVFIFIFYSFFLMGQCMIDSVYINAILIDPSSSSVNYDTNDNGFIGSEDEYIEICNASTNMHVDVSGWQFGDDDSSPFPDFVMPDSSMIAPGECLLLVNKYCPDLGDPTDCVPPAGIIDIAYSGTGMLGNSGDIIAMANADGSVSCSVVYGNTSCDSIDILDILPFDINNCVSWGTDIDGCPLLVSGDSCTYLAQSLPVEFIEFRAEKYNDDNVLLSWATAIEINNDRFEVEWSLDAESYYRIGEVGAKPNGLERQDYQFLHSEPESGVNYYRLKQVDLNGAFDYSEIRSVNIFKAQAPQIHPSLTRDNIHIVGNNDTYVFGLYDLQGRLVMDERNVMVNEPIDISQLHSAYYLARITDGNETYFLPIFKY